MRCSLTALPVLVLTLSLVGCTPATPPAPAPSPSIPATPGHDPDDVPITEEDVDMPADYATAMERINGYRDAIRTAIEAGTPSKAHRPLDELDIVLNRLPEIARDSGVPKENWEEVNTASRALRDLFNTLHTSIDAGEAPDYPAVADGIEDTIARLAAANEAPAEDGAAPDGDDAGTDENDAEEDNSSDEQP